MTTSLKKILITAFIVLFTAGCTKQTTDSISPDILKNVAFLSSAELKDIEGVLNKTDTRRYEYRVVQVTAQQNDGFNLTEKRKADIQGLLVRRNKDHLDPLGGEFYADGQGNLLQLGGPKDMFSMTYMANGTNILAIDADHDELVDTVIGNIDINHFWIISEHLADLLPCLSSSDGDIYDAALDCTEQEIPGNGGNGNAGSGGTPDIGSDLLGEPDCDPAEPGSIVTGDNPGTPPGEDPAPPPPPPSSKSPDDEDYPPMGWSESYSTEADGRQTRTTSLRTSEGVVETTTGTNSDGSVLRTTIHRDSQGRETYREDVFVGPGPDRKLLMHRVNHTTYDSEGNPSSEVTVSRQARSGSSLQPINPDGSTVFKDPRCAGRDTRVSQGLGFLDICAQHGSTDFLACYRQLESPLFNVSGGRCRLEPGPAGGKVLTCSGGKSITDCIAEGGSPEECARSGSGNDDITGPGGPDAGPVDGPQIPGTQKIDTRFIDTIPLGAFLAGICSRGGCPDPKPF